MFRDFPDKPYLDRIRTALWRPGMHGNAAVMVGAGFSLNAKPSSAGSGSFPTWAALAKAVVDNLYPLSGSSVHRIRALKQAEATSGFLRLAQEYQSAFGREALERLIIESVPDQQFGPSDIHELLLDLPWADVFTTNWDTLLERTADRVVNRKYDVIRMVADLPSAMRPRIVKLHGTLGTSRPFVFTEEDFRRYPHEQAPFVNLAQQAMMENVFCLLGFSGDDPNFLYWSGWVRDHLGPYRPQIYLVGWLDLPQPQRRLLEERGVVPIDCARLPLREPWPEELRHRYSVDWFLWNLKMGEPYKPNSWPMVRSRRGIALPPYLDGLIFAAEGLLEPVKESRTLSPLPSVNDLRSQIEDWRHNRDLYPGWLIAPHSTQVWVWEHTQAWIPELIRLLPELSDVDKIEYLEEFNWRIEVSLVPLSDGLPEAIEAVLVSTGSIACNIESVEGILLNMAGLRRKWLNLAIALLRHARQSADDEAFERWSTALLPCVTLWPDLLLWLRYERCLLSLARLDHRTVEKELAQWETDTCDSYWKIRRAGLLAEIGRVDEAFLFTREALSEIRRQTRKDIVDIGSLSREGWAMVLARGFDFYPHRRRNSEVDHPETLPRGIEEEERAERRWEILRMHECDAWERLEECWRDLQKEPPGDRPEEHEVPGFDPGHRTRIGHLPFGGEENDSRYLPGYRTRLLLEKVGVPPVVDMVDLSKSLLLRTAAWLQRPVPNEALGLVLRACSYEGDETFNLFLTRNRIALLESGEVEGLINMVQAALTQGIPKAVAANIQGEREAVVYWLGRLRVAVELLSRLVLRLNIDQAERVIDQALGYMGQALFIDHHWLIEPLSHLIFRALEVLDYRAQRYIPRFVDLPVPGEDNFNPKDNRNWPDPLVMIANTRFPEPVVAALDPSAIRRLIGLVGSSPLPRPREYAVRRLSILLGWGLLTEDDKNAFGEALWRFRLHSSGFPEGTRLYDFAFLELPEPQQGLASEIFRNRYLMADNSVLGRLSADYLRNVAGAFRRAREGRSGGFSLLPTDIEGVAGSLVAWWRSEGVSRSTRPRDWSISFDFEDFQDVLVIALGRVVLPGIRPDSPLVSDLCAMVEDLRSAAFPVEHIYPALAHLQPGRLPEIADRLRQSLASTSRRTAEAAVQSVWWWLLEGRNLGLSNPPEDLVREIALAISLRRASCLKIALSAAEGIILNAPEFAGQRFLSLISEGLSYLLEEARYDAQQRRIGESSFAPEETSDVRARCAKAALAGVRGNSEHLQVFEEWVRQAQADPLPEVRFAVLDLGRVDTNENQ